MKASNAKKRRLAALAQLAGQASIGASPFPSSTSASLTAGNGARGPSSLEHGAAAPPRRPTTRALRPPMLAAAAGAGPSTALPPQQAPHQPAHPTPGTDTSAFPYAPLPPRLRSSQAAVRLGVLPCGPATSAAAGAGAPGAAEGAAELAVGDVLERLMAPHMPGAVARGMIATRTTDKSVLLDNPTARLNLARPSAASKARQPKLAARLLPHAKRAELARLPSSGLDYARLLQLHELWCGYVSGVLAGKGGEQAAAALAAADWHGAQLSVASAKQSLLAGRVGIVAKATAQTFVLVGADGRTSTVPLKGCEFVATVPLRQGGQLHVRLAGPSAARLAVRLLPQAAAAAAAVAAAAAQPDPGGGDTGGAAA